MKLSPKERAARRNAFQNMRLAEKLEYIFMYYRLPIALGTLAFVVLIFTVSRALTKKDPVLYLACVNVTVGDALHETLTERFVETSGMDARKNEVYAYTGLYLSDDPAAEYHEYSYASRLKILAAVNAKQLDVVLMNREAYDILSRSGYLLELPPQISGDWRLPEALESCLRENTVVLEDNAIEYSLNEAESYQAVTEIVPNALEVSSLSVFRKAGFPDSVYLAVIANSPRLSASLRYIDYLAAQE